MPPRVSPVLLALSFRFSPSRLSSASIRSARDRDNCACASNVAWNCPAMLPCPAITASNRGSGRAGSGATALGRAKAKITAAATTATARIISPISMLLDPSGLFAYLQGMTAHPILTAPDPRLKAVSTPVEKVDGDIRKLAQDMADSMYAADGIGLAAVQIGVPKRVIVMDLNQKESDEKG